MEYNDLSLFDKIAWIIAHQHGWHLLYGESEGSIDMYEKHLLRVLLADNDGHYIDTFNEIAHKVLLESEQPTLLYKGYSRCFVFKDDDVPKVIDIIQQIDQFEYEYMPDDWVTIWSPECLTELVYNGKFDLDTKKLADECRKQGIEIAIFAKKQENWSC